MPDSSADRQQTKDDADDNNSHKKVVTDPITHQRLKLHDHTEVKLEQVPPAASTLKNKENVDSKEQQNVVNDTVREVTSHLYSQKGLSNRDGERRMYVAVIAAAAASCGMIVVNMARALLGRWAVTLVSTALVPLLAWLVYKFAPIPAEAHMRDDRESDSDQSDGKQVAKSSGHPRNVDDDSTAWVNAILTSLWPIVNPALFISISDMIEDQMQATLPPFIHGLKVADLGQGAVPVHVISLVHLPDGDANKEVNGMKAEEGDFINFEICLGYRGTDTSTHRSGNAHLLIEFVTIAGLTIPTWISLTSMLLNARIRVQLTPNPPFFSLATLSLTGQPHIAFVCTPLAKRKFLDVMDVPGLAPWVKNCVNSAVQGYIAPRSLDLNIPVLLGMGGGLDVTSAGIIWIKIDKAWAMRNGDAVKIWKKPGEDGGGKGDIYVTIGWTKWGKRVWASRVIPDDTCPIWNQETALVVGNAEITSGERLKIQLWDSDRMTADDLLGTIEVVLADIMNEQRAGRMEDREDKLLGEKEAEKFTSEMLKNENTSNHDGRQDAGEATSHPSSSSKSSSDSSKARKHGQGTIAWSIGFFAKTGLVECMDDDEDKAQGFRDKVWKEAENKLREDMSKQAAMDNTDDDGQVKQEETEGKEKEKDEFEQLKHADLKEKTDELIASQSPSVEWPSGILQVTIESIEGLEIEDVRGAGEKAGQEVEGEGGAEEVGEQKKPSAYCDIVINCERWYKTRVKVRDGKPYFNVSTERFVRDWTSSSVMIAVRDSRLHEAHPIIGVICLPLSTIFSDKSHIEDSFPLTGGIGFGKVRATLTFRSVKIKLPQKLRGWDVGSVAIAGDVQVVSNDGVGMIGEELRKCKVVVRAVCDKGKLYAVQPDDGHIGGVMKWREKKGRVIKLPIQRRYTECVIFEFRKHEKGISKGIKHLGHEMVIGFSVVWLADLEDSTEMMNDEDEEAKGRAVQCKVWSGGEGLKRARRNRTEEGIGEEMKGVIMSVKMRFIPGMREAHRLLAKKDPSVRNVIDALGCVESTDGGLDPDGHDSDNDSSSDSDQSSKEDNEKEGDQDEGDVREGRLKAMWHETQGYKERSSELHRKHRGIMQWKPARQAVWAGKGVEKIVLGVGDKVKEKVAGRGDGDGGQAVEKEV